jgi:hypothetical protein
MLIVFLRWIWVWRAALCFTTHADMHFYDAHVSARECAEMQMVEHGNDPRRWDEPHNAVLGDLSYWTNDADC